ncbi:MAG: hypothetical protein ABJL54_15090 [Halioglobus sp.]
MKRFDLTFKGDILPHNDPLKVREGLAELFQIRDPLMLEELFSGDTFVLRSNLDRKPAADYFRKIKDIGGIAELVATDSPGGTADRSQQQVMTRVRKEDPAAFLAARPARPGDAGASPAFPNRSSTPAVSNTETTEPAPSEILAKLERLKLDAKASHESKIEQLRQMQEEVKTDTSAALERIGAEREQALLAAQDEFTRLQRLEIDSKAQLDKDLSIITEEEAEKQRRFKRKITHLDEQAEANRGKGRDIAEQLVLDRSNCQSQAESNIKKLEAQIAAAQEQARVDLEELDRIEQEGEARQLKEQQRLELQAESLQEAYEQSLSSLQVQRQEHERHQAAELKEIHELYQLADRTREDRLTDLWEREEQFNATARERLQQLEATRARHQKSLDQRLQRFKQEEDKVKKSNRPSD